VNELQLKQEKLQALEAKNQYYNENRLEFYDPYPFQVEFHHDMEKKRGLQAANQIGKSLSSTAEDAYHLTGRYPDWWEGRKFDKPIRLICGGVNNDKTRDLLQKALFGDPQTWREEPGSLGTGWVPKKDIGKVTPKRGVPDAFFHVKVKHHTNGVFDGWSQCTFLAYEMGKATWMGDTIDIFHLDEEPPMDILTQAGRGCIASGGIIYLSYTPENGRTDVVQMIEKTWSFHQAEWVDVAGEDFDYTVGEGVDKETLHFKTVLTLRGKPGHLTLEKVKDAEKTFPSYTIKMRAKGIPVLGSGLVFEYSENIIKCEPIDIPDTWARIAAVDFGGISKSAHPSAVVYGAYDHHNDVVYIYDGFRIYSGEIADVAARMLSRPGWIPVMWPHDGNKEVPGGGTVAQEYKGYGVNMFETHFTNPPDEGKAEGSGGIKIEPGIVAMGNRIKDRRIRVFSTFPEWFQEYRQYHLKDGKIVDREDDLMAATRIAVQSIRHAEVEEDEEDFEDDYSYQQKNSVTGY